MTGALTSRGCESCRARKKKCDQAKPTCGRCTRLKIKCVGSGTKRFKFVLANADSRHRDVSNAVAKPSLRPTLANDASKVASEFIFIMGIEDVKYTGFAFAAFLYDLPQRLGSNPTVDAGIKAALASFKTIHDRQHKRKALGCTVDAISKLRTDLQASPSRACTDNTLYAIILMAACHAWLGGHDANRPKTGRVLMRLLYEAVVQDRVHDFPPNLVRQTLAIIIFESFWDHEVEFAPWFWGMLNGQVGARPLNYSPMYSVLPQSMAEISVYLRDPIRYLCQIQAVYTLMLSEYPSICASVQEAKNAAAKPDVPFTVQQQRIQTSNLYNYFLSQILILNRFLQIHHDKSYRKHGDLHQEADMFCDDVIIHATSSLRDRPFATMSIPLALMSAWASISDSVRLSELDELMSVYQNDFEGLNYTANAKGLRCVFDSMEEHIKTVAETATESKWRPNMEGVTDCVIL